MAPVVYIMGYGRSGSTAMDAVLGTHPSVCSVGELVNLVGRSSPKRGSGGGLGRPGGEAEYCACGERGNVCAFWTAVRRDWAERIHPFDVADYLTLQRTFEARTSWPRLVGGRAVRSDRFRTYARVSAALFDAIRAVSGRAVVVDSSKLPMRAYALSAAGLDVRLVHLVRDARGVSWSLRKPHPKDERAGIQRDLRARPAAGTALMWVLVNLQAIWVRRQLLPSASLVVRYEDFVMDTAATLARLGDVVGLDFGKIPAALPDPRPIPVGHNIAGNMMRMRGRFRLQLDVEWVECLSPADRRIVWAIAGPLMRRFGYERS
jgi:hypothetical protein